MFNADIPNFQEYGSMISRTREPNNILRLGLFLVAQDTSQAYVFTVLAQQRPIVFITKGNLHGSYDKGCIE